MADSFSDTVRRCVRDRVGGRCSRPGCSQGRSFASSNPEKAVVVGDAAHICAASPGGPRFNPSQGASERRSPVNAIWLCPSCHRLVDSDPARYTVEMLIAWKAAAELRAGDAASANSEKPVKAVQVDASKANGVQVGDYGTMSLRVDVRASD